MITKLKTYLFEILAFVSFFVAVVVLVIRILHLNIDVHMQMSLTSFYFILVTLAELSIAVLLVYALPLWFVFEIITIQNIKIEKPEICHQKYIISSNKRLYRNPIHYRLNCVVRC